MPYYVCKGAKLKCSMGSDQSALEVMHLEKPVNLHGKPMAGIMDHKPMVNIKPFGQCKSLANPVVASATAANYGRLQEMPCIPNTMSPWLNGKMNVFVKGQPALLDSSKCLCLWAGVIEIADAGQDTVQDGGGSQVSQSTGASAAGADSAATTPGGNALASQGTAVPQGAGAADAPSKGRLLIRKVESETEGEVLPGDVVTYKVSVFNIDGSDYSTNIGRLSDYDKRRVRWAVKANDGIAELKGRNGDSIALEMKPAWAGEEISVMACVEGFNENVCQKTRVGGAGKSSAGRFLIKKVEGKSEASPGEDVEYKVTHYSIGGDTFSTYQKSLSAEENRRIRWAMKIGDGGIKELFDENGEKINGEGIKIKIDSRLVGVEIVVMACIEGFNEKVSQRTRVIKKELPPVDFLPISFSTIDEAGVYAVRNINQLSIDKNKEFGGRIYELGGRYYVNSPIEGEKDRIEALPESRSGGKLVGWYHTHGRSYEEIDQEFSPYDIAVSDEYGITAYLGTTINDNVVRKYTLKPPLAPRKEKDIDRNYLKFLRKNGYISELL